MTTDRKPLNSDQNTALEAILDWLPTGAHSGPFVLEGPAGTGKTYIMPDLVQRVRGSVVFTAPTNKATRVLRSRLTSDEYRPDCRTTYSLLGLSLQANGEVRELSVPEEPVDLSSYRLMVVDEGSMVGDKLLPHIREATEQFGLPVLFMADRYQLPPVGEVKSKIFAMSNGAQLTKIERYDNQILALATEVRKAIDMPIPRVTLRADNDGDEGVWKIADSLSFERRFLDEAREGRLSKPDTAKAIAWRNVRVDQLNKLARFTIFGQEATRDWLPGDRVIFTAPANDLEGEKVASTDDEGVVTAVAEEFHPLAPDVKVWAISITLDDNRRVLARVLHPLGQPIYSNEVDRLATEARFDKRKWKAFWSYKELFHNLRHAYAITAHRAQGSTFETVLVDTNDIMLNRERKEAFQCFYVALTRASKQLIIR